MAQHDLLNQVNPKTTDFIFIQEPHIDFLNLTRANHHWMVVYPSTHHNTPVKTRSVTLVSWTISKNNWRQVPVTCSDMTAVKLTSTAGPVTFYNIYNTCNNSDTLSLLQNCWSQHNPQEGQTMNGKSTTHCGTPWKTHISSRQQTSTVQVYSSHCLKTTTWKWHYQRAYQRYKHSTPETILFCSTDLLPSSTECNTHPHLKPA